MFLQVSSEDDEDVVLEDDLEVGPPDMLRLGERSQRVARQTKGDECEYIRLPDVRNNSGCVAGQQS